MPSLKALQIAFRPLHRFNNAKDKATQMFEIRTPDTMGGKIPILRRHACAWRCGLLGVSRGPEFPAKVVPFHTTRKQAASSQVKGSHLAASGMRINGVGALNITRHVFSIACVGWLLTTR